MKKITLKIILFYMLNTSVIWPFCIHVIGDSHARSFINNNTPIAHGYNKQTKFLQNSSIPIKVHWVGPITMHRIGRDGLNGIEINQANIKQNDIVIFVFGEIDVRCHIGKQRDTQKRDLHEIIDTLVKNYIKSINQHKSLNPYDIAIIFGATPPTNQGFNPQYPFYGHINERINITKLLNEKLKQECLLNNIEFLNVYDFYCDNQGHFLAKLSDNSVHINSESREPVQRELSKVLAQANKLPIT